MIKFEKDKFTIEVRTNSNPIEAWLETQEALLDLLENADFHKNTYYHVFVLLKEMLSDMEQANNRNDSH